MYSSNYFNIDQLIDKINNLENKAKLFEIEKHNLNNKNDFCYSNLKSKYDSLIQENTDLKSNINILKKELNKFKNECKSKDLEVLAFKDKLNSYEQNNLKLSEDNQELKEKITLMSKQLREKEEENLVQSQEINLLSSNFRELKTINQESNKNLLIFKKYHENKEEENKNYHSKNQDYELKFIQQDSLINELSNEINHLKQTNNSLDQENMNIKMTLGKIEEKNLNSNKELENMNNKNFSLQSEKDEFIKKISMITNEKDYLNTLYNKLRVELDQVRKENQIALDLMNNN